MTIVFNLLKKFCTLKIALSESKCTKCLSGKSLRLFCYLILFLPIFIVAQTQPQTPAPISITVKGKIICNEKIDFSKVMVFAKHAGIGVFADVTGTFNVSLKKNDTLMISCVGFANLRYAFKDSVQKTEYNIEAFLQRPIYSLKEITVYPLKSLAEIRKNINKISIKKTNIYKEVNKLESPITALYERFSRMERSKRTVAQLENEDLKRQALKDLFRLYIKFDIISLNDEKFDAFIDYCNLSDQFIINASEYELVEAIKVRYKAFQSQNDYYREK